jgi:hypothetical protein
MKKYVFYIATLVSFLLASCSKSYFDINQNPNTATETSITPDLLLPTALHNTGTMVGANYASQARWMGAWTRGGDYGPNQEEESYQITTNFGAAQWANWYNFTFDYDVIEKKSLATGQNIYAAIAKTMKTIAFMNLVDMYNNVPYSKAFDLSGNILTPYDKGADIYKDLFKQLDQAMVLLNTAVPNADFNIAKTDIMYNGSIVKWKQFINTQRLKLVLRVHGVASFDKIAEIAKINADGSGFIPALPTGDGSASVNPGYTKANNTAGLSQQNPFWDNYKANVSGVEFDNFNRANNFALNLLKSSGDIRYQYYFDKATTPVGGNLYAGMPYGYPSIAGLPSSLNTSGVGGPGLAKSISQRQWIFTSVESLFLQAEAKQRGYSITGPDAKTLFENGIRESFTFLGVPNAVAAANAYIASSPFANFGVGGSIPIIMKQKYLSMIGMNNFEPWTDYRRVTGSPATTPADRAEMILFFLGAKSENSSAAANKIPLRFRYPQREYNFNAGNVAAQGNPDPQSAKIFWAE